MTRNPNCTLCKLHKTAEFVCLWGAGPTPCDVMIIGEGPGHREDAVGRAFVGHAGQLLDKMLEAAGLERDKVYITNATKCKPGASKPRTREIKACKPYLNQELADVKPKCVMLLGNIALESVLGLKGIKRFRGRHVEWNGVIYFPTYHPAFVLRGEGKDLPTLEADFRAFGDITRHGIPEEKGLNSVIIDTWAKVDTLIDALTGVVSLDIETTCLYPWAPEAAIVTVGFGTAIGEFSLFISHRDAIFTLTELKIILSRAHRRLDDCIVVAQNGKFDALWLYVHYGLTFHISFDTMMAHYLLDENDRHNLTHLAQMHYGAHNWDIPLEDKQGRASAAVIAKYHAHDLFYTRNLYYTLKEKLKLDPAIWRLFNNLTMPCVNLYMRMEANGACVDVERMDKAEAYLNQEIDAATRALRQHGDINWASPKQVGELLYGKLKIKCPMRTKKGAPSTAESALNMIDHPAVTSLKRLRAANQEKSFFVDGWAPYIVDDRLHPSFKLHGTVTGRPSCEHPNFQQTTREPRIRSLITAPSGFELLEADLSQIELRIVAQLSREPSMVAAFRDGTDIHWLTTLREIERGAALKDLVIDTASTLTQRNIARYGEAIQILLKAGVEPCEEIDHRWKELRKKAKAINFGFVFSMYWKRFKQYALDNYGIKLTDDQAQASRIAFFQMYQLEDWHKAQQRYARTRGFVRALSGQKRRLPAAMSREDTPERAEALRQAINSPVQGFAAHLLLMVLMQMSREFSWEVFRPFATVHDALLAEVREDYVERIAERIEEIMRSPALLSTLDIELDIPICGEVKIGPWGSGVSLQRWKNERRDQKKMRA